MDVKMVVRRESEQTHQREYLTVDCEWSLDKMQATRYCSMVAFSDAAIHHGSVCLRFVNGQEVEVSYGMMFEQPEWLQ
jgi:hypothetical protein